MLYFESPSGSAAQFNVPDDVVAAGHVYELDVAVVVADAAAVAVALADGTEPVEAPEPPQPANPSASVSIPASCLFIGRSVRPLTWPSLRRRRA